MTNGKYETTKFESYPTFKQILDIFDSDPEFYASLLPYIHSLIFTYNSTTRAYPTQAYDWLLNNYFNKDSDMDPRSKDMMEALINHLNDRLSKHEC